MMVEIFQVMFMKQLLANKQIVLGVTGGIAAYKSADLVRRLREVGAKVRVVMTESAKQFITPLTMQAVSGYPVHDDLFDLKAEAAMGHIELARWADVILVAPATADFMANLARGEAKDLLSTLCVATRAPIALAPAMNQGMWKNNSTQENVQVLQRKGIHLFGPGEGDQACGDVGPGRMIEPLEIVARVGELFSTGSLAGKHVVVTAGPTREPIDPVRYISNASSGKMGYALAEAALEAGAQVTLVSGPVNLPKPSRINCIDVLSAQEMLDAVMSVISESDIFIGVAAVADYRCQTISPQKIAKTKTPTLNLILERNPDIVASVAALKDGPFVVGFAAETENLIANARVKLQNKKLDMIVANLANESIDRDDNVATVLWNDEQVEFEKMSKQKLARELVELIASLRVT
jgi:phosphopantothenoylcysteine decarboxylase/phosphopantothenate--cysteine ligase